MIFKKGISTGLYLMLALVLCAGNRARAQAVFGSIYGTVADSSGAAIPNATVTVTDVDKGINQTVQSNESGNYRIDRLVPDTYMVKVSANGFADVETKGIVVTANGAPKVDETLSIAGTSQQVTVTSAPPALQTDSAQISDRVDEKTIANLPNLTGNFMQTQALTAGTSPSTGNNSASPGPPGIGELFDQRPKLRHAELDIGRNGRPRPRARYYRHQSDPGLRTRHAGAHPELQRGVWRSFGRHHYGRDEVR